MTCVIQRSKTTKILGGKYTQNLEENNVVVHLTITAEQCAHSSFVWIFVLFYSFIKHSSILVNTYIELV